MFPPAGILGGVKTSNTATGGLVVELANPHGEPVQLGPFRSLRFEGESLLAGPAGEVIAEHVDHRWARPDGSAYSRLRCSAPVQVHFHSVKDEPSKKLGPFESFSSVDGVAYANHRVLAFCDRDLQDWYSYDIGSHWKVMSVEPA